MVSLSYGAPFIACIYKAYFYILNVTIDNSESLFLFYFILCVFSFYAQNNFFNLIFIQSSIYFWLILATWSKLVRNKGSSLSFVSKCIWFDLNVFWNKSTETSFGKIQRFIRTPFTVQGTAWLSITTRC